MNEEKIFKWHGENDKESIRKYKLNVTVYCSNSTKI